MQLEQALTQYIIHQGGSVNTSHVGGLMGVINREQGRPAPDAEAKAENEEKEQEQEQEKVAPVKKEKKK